MTPLVFPQDQPDGKAGLARQGGLELRDYFAAQALPGLIDYHGIFRLDDAATDAYLVADHMLKARANA